MTTQTRSPTEALEAACQILGGKSALARELDIKPPSVHEWFTERPVPVDRSIQIEKLVAARIVAEKLDANQVFADELRPDCKELFDFLRNSGEAA